MKLKDAAKQAVQCDDAVLAGKVADVLRFRFRMNYEETYDWVRQHVEVDRRTWESLLYESEVLW